MSEADNLTGRERAVVAAVAALIAVLAMLRPTPSLGDQDDRVDVVPIDATALSGAGPRTPAAR